MGLVKKFVDSVSSLFPLVALKILLSVHVSYLSYSLLLVSCSSSRKMILLQFTFGKSIWCYVNMHHCLSIPGLKEYLSQTPLSGLFFWKSWSYDLLDIIAVTDMGVMVFVFLAICFTFNTGIISLILHRYVTLTHVDFDCCKLKFMVSFHDKLIFVLLFYLQVFVFSTRGIFCFLRLCFFLCPWAFFSILMLKVW